MKTSTVRLSFVAAIAVSLTVVGISLSHADPAPVIDWAALKAKFRRPTSVPFPKDNPHTPAREALGKALFFDTRLSGSKAISCASCHNPAFSWGDGLPKGVGHAGKQLGRRSPTILNVAWGELYFWDGRADSLEAQALGPVESAAEMNMSLEDMIASLEGIPGYAPLFEIAYPGEGISKEAVAKAIATFERTVVSGIAPFDRWIAGEENAIPDSAKRGFRLFTGKALCSECHSGWNFTDDGFHDIGIIGQDIGRGAHLKQIEAVQYAFKTPTLRNVALRAPYMHDGSERTLEDVVRLYNEGGKVRRPAHDINVKPLNLSDTEVKELCDFMETLTSHDAPVAIPVLPR